MIKLHPMPDASHRCPFDNSDLAVTGWYIPGMRNLADLRCPQCGREFYGDLLAGHGLYYPMLLDKQTGEVHGSRVSKWFADWLRESYASRVGSPVGFVVEQFRPLKQVVLLNCLDTLYGHCLLKLLDAQYFLDKRPDLDLVVLVPRLMRWMVPDGAAAIWTVDLPLRRGAEWNDWLAAEIRRRIEPLEACSLSIAFSHPHPEDYDIERFTRVRPFPIDEWEARLTRPTVSFIWREDRVWQGSERRGPWHDLSRRARRRLGLWRVPLEEQSQRVVAFARLLRQQFPQTQIAVVGLGRPGGLPGWMADLRTPEINEATERAWCEQYARSHVVIGVHGSNMLLPSAHAGAVVELMPAGRWGNVLQDLLFRPEDCRETLFRCRILPLTVVPGDLALATSSLLKDHCHMLVTMRREFCNHPLVAKPERWSIAFEQHLPRLAATAGESVDLTAP